MSNNLQKIRVEDTVAVYFFDGADLKVMLRGAVKTLEQSKTEIDALNVFPVADGDTGTNMYKTLSAALNEALPVNSNHIGIIAEAAARGSLMGARGNSGVILSQVLYGFARSLSASERASAADIATALEDGAQTAYKAVLSPVEGTILTVIRKSAEGASSQRKRRNLLRVVVSVLKNAMSALHETPELLPVLKQAGVVDAGGKGFVVILEGIIQVLKSASPSAKTTPPYPPAAKRQVFLPIFPDSPKPSSVIDFVYCTELLIKSCVTQLEAIKAGISPLGDSLLVVGDKDMVKVHIHTNHPGLIIEHCLKFGALHDVKVNNMLKQNSVMVRRGKTVSEPGKPFGIVAVGAGEGIEAIFKNLSVDAVVSGGQTMNPSTGEILNAINNVDTDRIIILPNNNNVVLAAEQAGVLAQKEVAVIPTRSIPQGFSALLSLNPFDDFQSATAKMNRAIKSVRSGEITSAVRDTACGDFSVKKGDIIGLLDGDLKVCGNDIERVLENLITFMIDGEGHVITLYCGKDMKINEAKDLADKISKKFHGQDFEVQYGGQPVYELIISVE
ncbi:MAG TPA: DAK2 domain-containing protein [Bacillota bacterium]|nr:DAK2 domain-containing protein [Bacillota bacterium]